MRKVFNRQDANYNLSLLPTQALSPLDGRYAERLSVIRNLFSEYGLIQNRVTVEIEYLIFLLEKTQIQELSTKEKKALRQIYEHFSEPAAQRIKELEDKCHHDVKAVEYFLQEECKKLKLERVVPYIHFGLTSEDINSCAYGLAIQKSVRTVFIPQLSSLITTLLLLAENTADSVMLAKTHGQPAVPTTLGKEVMVFVTRLEKTLAALDTVHIEAKVSGAVGNWNALDFVLPDHDWPEFSNQFIQKLGLKPNLVATQIVPAESYSEYFQILVRINTILIDCSRDFWQYISDSYVLQKVEDNHVGSSTMPQKVNPIDFENSEGNAGIAIALLQHFIEKLPISRLQRDLSDSTVKRSIGTAFGHTLLALTSLKKGLEKLEPNDVHMKEVLAAHPEVLAEALQTALRLSGDTTAYESIKELTRGKPITKKDLDGVAQNISDLTLKQAFLDVQTNTYIGQASNIVSKEISRIRKILTTLGKD